MAKWYVGHCIEGMNAGRSDLFTADASKDATPEASGYDEVEGPFKSREEALEACPNAN